MIIVEAHHHGSGDGGPERDRHAVSAAAQNGRPIHVGIKHICKNVAKRHGKTVTFMPKPIFEDNGSGMHTHISLWKGNTPLRWQRGHAGLSELGLCGRCPRACAGDPRICGADDQFPTAGSCPASKRLLNLAPRREIVRAAIRIPMYSKSPKAGWRVPCPDPSCNGYPRSAMLMAMLDGIQNRIDPGQPLDRDICEMTRDEMKHMGIRTTPGSLDEAINALEQDHAFLLRGDVLYRRSHPDVDCVEARTGTRSDAVTAGRTPTSFISTTTTDTARSGDRRDQESLRSPDFSLSAADWKTRDDVGGYPDRNHMVRSVAHRHGRHGALSDRYRAARDDESVLDAAFRYGRGSARQLRIRPRIAAAP